MVGKTSVGGEKSVVGDLFCGCAGQLSWEPELKVWEGSGGARSAWEAIWGSLLMDYRTRKLPVKMPILD